MLTAPQTNFVNQMARKVLVEWCEESLRTGEPPLIDPKLRVYKEHAIIKKWVSAKDGRILAAGWNTAAAFLKR